MKVYVVKIENDLTYGKELDCIFKNEDDVKKYVKIKNSKIPYYMSGIQYYYEEYELN